MKKPDLLVLIAIWEFITAFISFIGIAAIAVFAIPAVLGNWNNWMPYITGGAAFGDIKAENPAGTDASKTKIGWTAGLGLEYALRSNWSVKLEYLYADLGSFDCGLTCGAPTDNVTFKTNIVRAGVNYRF